MKITTLKLKECIERKEHDKPLIVQWTDHDEEVLQIYKELYMFRIRGNYDKNINS
jgi:hypothetical protein